MSKKIKLAAIKRKSDGIVFTGRNHAEIILTRPKGELKGSEQGFITDENVFVSRGEAGRIAFEAGQTKKREDLLFSEDLTGDWPWAKDVIKKLQAELAKLEAEIGRLKEELERRKKIFAWIGVKTALKGHNLPIQKWHACICYNGKRRGLGYFNSEIEAAKTYDAKARELFGEFACTNF